MRIRFACIVLIVASVTIARADTSAPARGLDLLVSVLGKMDDPAVQADVLSGMLQGLSGRRSAPMPSGWEALYPKLSASRDARVRSSAAALALLFGDARARDGMRQKIADGHADVSDRATAIEALAGVHDDKLGAILVTLLDDANLRDAALRYLAAYAEPGTAPAVIDRYGQFTPPQRMTALGTLASRATWAKALLDAVADGKIPRADVSAILVRQLSNLRDAEVDRRLKDAYGAVRPHAANKASLLATYKKTFTPDLLSHGDAAHGRVIFNATCGVCHTLFDAGGKVGPDLTGAQRSNIDYLLEKITDPSAVVPKENYTNVIETRDGRTIVGIVKQETDAAVTIRDAANETNLPKSEIKSRKTSATSIMPEGLLEAMSTADARDLLAYLQSAKQVPLK